MRWIGGGKAVEREAASTSQMGRFETEWLASDQNLAEFVDLPGRWIDGKLRNPQVVLGRVFPLPTPVIGPAKDVPCADLTNQLLATQ